MLRNRFFRALTLLLTVSLFLCPLISCQKKADPLAKSGFSSLTVDKKNRLNAEIVLDAADLEAHAGQSLLLYELSPTEELSALSKKEPLDSARVASVVTLSTDLISDEHSRLYSRFYAAFSDGTMLSTDGFWIETPQAIATDTESFAWSKSQKGVALQDPDLAVELGSMHLMLDTSFSELTSDTTESFLFGGTAYPISHAALDRLDKQVIEADAAGMQISLTLTLDSNVTRGQATALLDLLAARYSNGSYGSITAFFLDAEDEQDAAELAFLCRTASLAIRSRIANARVYVVSDATTVTETKTFFSNLQLQLSLGGKISWGAAIRPVLTDTPWEKATSDLMSVNRLDELNRFLTLENNGARAEWLAVCDLSFSADKPEQQAVAFAYAYREAIAATATLVYYDATDPAYGFYTEDGQARRIASLFSDIDTVLSQEDELLCERTVGDAWSKKIADLDSRKKLSGIATLGSAGFAEKPLFELSADTDHGFTSVNGTQPTVHNSAAWNAPVLATWVDPKALSAGGLRTRLTDTEALQETVSLSTWVLTAQAGNATSCTLRLTLEGESETQQRVTYSADIEIPHGEWQLVTFQIADFVAEADLSRPTYLTLTTAPETTPDEDFVFYLKDLYVRAPRSGCGTLVPVLMIIACVAVSGAAMLLLYRRTSRKHR